MLVLLSSIFVFKGYVWDIIRIYIRVLVPFYNLNDEVL